MCSVSGLLCPDGKNIMPCEIPASGNHFCGNLGPCRALGGLPGPDLQEGWWLDTKGRGRISMGVHVGVGGFGW